MKKIFQKLLGSKEIKAVLGILDEASHKFNNQAFEIVKSHIEKMILAHPDKLKEVIKNGMSPRQWVYGAISNISGDLAESGEYHIHRGVLNPIGPGEDLLKIFDTSTDELVKIGNIDVEYAKKQKDGIRENIKDVG